MWSDYILFFFGTSIKLTFQLHLEHVLATKRKRLSFYRYLSTPVSKL